VLKRNLFSVHNGTITHIYPTSGKGWSLAFSGSQLHAVSLLK
jgi:hypothetical protein